MSTFGLVLLFASVLAAQPQLTLSTTSPAFPGSTLTVQVNLAGSTGLNIAAIGYSDPAGSTGNTAGAASTAAAKTIYAFSTNVLLVGFANPAGGTVLNNTPFADGQIATFSYPVPASVGFGTPLSVGLTAPLASDASGATVVLTSAPLSLTVGVNPVCVTDLQSEVQAFTAGPTQALINQITSNLNAAKNGGVCQ